MPRFLQTHYVRILAVAVCLLLSTSTSNAYVVIQSIDVDGAAMDASSKGRNARGGKATGEVDDVQSGELSEEFGFRTPADRGPGKRGSKQGRSNRGNRSRYPSSNVSSGGGGGGGGAGGGGGGGGRSRRGRANRDVVQTVVIANDSSVEASESESDEGTDLTVYGDGPSEGGASGGSSGGGGGGGEENPVEQDNGPGHGGNAGEPCITGTPEPTALVVWAIAGCCGYGIVRFQNRRLTN